MIIGLAFTTIGMVEPLVPLYSLHLGASPATVGIIVAAAHVFPAFIAVPTGSLADRWGPRRVAALGAVLFLAGPALVVLMPGLPAVVAAQVLTGVGQLGLVLAGQTFVGLLAPAAHAEAYFGWYTTSVSAGQLVGPVLAGMLADAAGFRAAFGVTALVSLLPALLTRRLVDRPGADGVAAGAALTPREEQPMSKREMLRNPEFQVALFGSCGVLIAMGVRRAFLPLYLDELAFSASFIGFVVSVRALFSMLVRSVMPSIVRALGGRGMALVVTTMVAAVSIGTLGLVRSAPLLVLSAVLAGIGLGVTQPLTMVIASDAVPRSQHGLAMGIRLTGNRLAQLISPLIFGFVVEWGGYSSAFLVAGALLVSVALVTNRLRPRLDRRTAPPAQGAAAGR